MLKPTGHRVLVKQCPVKKMSSGGIIIAHDDEKISQNAVQIGVVVAVGPQAWHDFETEHDKEPWAKVGDLVYFPRYSGGSCEDPYTGDEYLVLNDKDIMIHVSPGENLDVELPEFEFIVKEEKMTEKQKKEVLLAERRAEAKLRGVA